MRNHDNARDSPLPTSRPHRLPPRPRPRAACRRVVPAHRGRRWHRASMAGRTRHNYGNLAHDSRDQPSRCSTRSRSNGPWTLGGRRLAGPKSRAETRVPGLVEAVPSGWWTLGGRQDPKPPLRDL